MKMPEPPPPARAAAIAWRRVRERVQRLAVERGLRRLQTFVIFVGFARTGHSVVGALLDAHRHALVADEINVLELAIAGIGRAEILRTIVRSSRVSAAHERRKAATWQPGFHYGVLGQWQGTWADLRVMGAVKAAASVRVLMHQPRAIQTLESVVGAPVKIVQVVRNPWDSVATLSRATGEPPTLTAQRFAHRCLRVDRIRGALAPDSLHTLRHERLIDQPHEVLAGLCRHLGLDAPRDYLEACARTLYDKPSRSRERVEWDAAAHQALAGAVERCGWLAGYGFDT